MVMAAMLSDIDKDDVARLADLIRKLGLPAKPPKIGVDAMRNAMSMDKKVLGKQLRFVLLEKLGTAYVSSDVDADRLSLTLEVLG